MKNYPKHVLFAVNVHGIMFLDVTSKVRSRNLPSWLWPILGNIDLLEKKSSVQEDK